MSEANEDRTSGDFKEMGGRLAGEVVAFLKKKVDKLAKYGGCKGLKLSFVGQSIGNIIIRTALAAQLSSACNDVRPPGGDHLRPVAAADDEENVTAGVLVLGASSPVVDRIAATAGGTYYRGTDETIRQVSA
ncbi:hypothetical protein GUJ93_ZPchr0009g772 [Zizania palustris]|uniref:DUF676 domain-containing protein n=1 Tax=Zizania palustris TaxID=103762 RepID=A0A8J5S4D3_ZIZPA|nr:hypothetical protein GUJ93_ZPchr0009g772 [Zizania palustris]